MPLFNRCFFANFTLFYPAYDKMYTKMYTTLLEQGTVLCITRFDPRHRQQRLFARCEGPFFCSFEFTLQNTIYLLK